MLSLNVYGVPVIKGVPQFSNTTYKEQRIAAIANSISKGYHDLYLLQELWFKSDYDIIKKTIPSDWYITDFEDFNVGSCTVVHGGPFSTSYTL